ncbi:alpha-glucuronidase, partial [Flavihumibacter sediminis]|nr:alpha-glucuronidase [Flavihumibacter sediminis]
DELKNKSLRNSYESRLASISLPGNSPTLQVARKELQMALSGLFGKTVRIPESRNLQAVLQIEKSSARVSERELASLGEEGFLIRSSSSKTPLLITANSEVGLLYGVFYLIRLLQTEQ